MSLTRSLLKELQISPDAAERIIAAHAESIDALRQERDAARGEAAQLESIRAALAEMTQARDEACQARDSAREELSALGGQFDSYRQQVETEKHQQTRHANLRAALQSAGANPHALDLLLLALHPDAVPAEKGGVLVQHTDDALLAVNGGQGGHTQIEAAIAQPHSGAAILGHPALGHVHAAHDLQSGQTCMGSPIPFNQVRRLKQRSDKINTLFKQDKYAYKRAIFVHVDSRNKGHQTDVFFYHQNKNSESKHLAKTMRTTFTHKYKKHQPGRGFTGTVDGRNLYVLRHTTPASVFVELGNIQNSFDQQRIILSDNRQALANWLCEGFVTDYNRYNIKTR